MSKASLTHYQEIKKAIIHLGQQNLTPANLISALNFLIIQKKISDKPITYSQNENAIAAWNMGCGSCWVNVNKLEGYIATSNEKILNPTLKSPADAERKSCCAEIIKILCDQNKGKIISLALQEAPPAKDVFYSQLGPIICHPNRSPKSNTNRTALVGCSEIDITDMTKRERLQAIQQITRSYNIAAKEFQMGLHSDNRLMLNLHLDYQTTDAGQIHRSAFITALHDYDNNLIILGDTNIKKRLLQTVGETFGIKGTEPVDLILSGNTQARHHQAIDREKPFL